MKMLAHNKLVASLLVVAGFVAWLVIGPIFANGWMRYIITSVVFFVVSCFLPETRRTTFLSRRSSLGLVGFFVWMAAADFMHLNPPEPITIGISILHSMFEVGGPISLGVAAYLLSIFLIRGFRATPEYCQSRGEQAPSNGGQRSSLNSGFHPRRG
jgi:hypothetical protein